MRHLPPLLRGLCYGLALTLPLWLGGYLLARWLWNLCHLL